MGRESSSEGDPVSVVGQRMLETLWEQGKTNITFTTASQNIRDTDWGWREMKTQHWNQEGGEKFFFLQVFPIPFFMSSLLFFYIARVHNPAWHFCIYPCLSKEGSSFLQILREGRQQDTISISSSVKLTEWRKRKGHGVLLLQKDQVSVKHITAFLARTRKIGQKNFF